MKMTEITKMNALELSTGEILIAKKERDRPACPFYSFSMGMMDSQGNQCGLKEEHTPCYMEVREEDPNWNKCDYNTPSFASQIKQNSDRAMFPNEFFPEGASSWDGIPLRDWMKYSMREA